VGLGISIVVVSFLSGVLLQRASSVIARNSVSPVNLTANVAQQLPQGYTSTIVGSGGSDEVGSYDDSPANLLTPAFAAIMDDYTNRTTMTLPSSGCIDQCTATFNGRGLVAKYTTVFKSVNPGGFFLNDSVPPCELQGKYVSNTVLGVSST